MPHLSSALSAKQMELPHLPPAISSAIFNAAVRAPIMFQPTLDQVRRAFRIVSGFTLLLAGAIMIVTPGPGWLTIFLGLSVLAAEFVWARRLMNRIKREGDRFKEAVLGVETSEEVGRPHGTPESSKEHQ